jgi:hypothetical protein
MFVARRSPSGWRSARPARSSGSCGLNICCSRVWAERPASAWGRAAGTPAALPPRFLPVDGVSMHGSCVTLLPRCSPASSPGVLPALASERRAPITAPGRGVIGGGNVSSAVVCRRSGAHGRDGRDRTLIRRSPDCRRSHQASSNRGSPRRPHSTTFGIATRPPRQPPRRASRRCVEFGEVERRGRIDVAA